MARHVSIKVQSESILYLRLVLIDQRYTNRRYSIDSNRTFLLTCRAMMVT